jgi:hypothetical protein
VPNKGFALLAAGQFATRLQEFGLKSNSIFLKIGGGYGQQLQLRRGDRLQRRDRRRPHVGRRRHGRRGGSLFGTK